MSIPQLAVYLTWLSPLVLILGVAIGAAHFKKIDAVHKFIWSYLIAAILFDLGGRIVAHYWGNNLIFVPLFALFELPIFALIYGRLLLKKFSILIYTISTFAFIFIIYECLTIESVNPLTFQSYSRTVGAFVISLLSLFYFFSNFFELDEKIRKKMRLNSLVLAFFSLNLILLLPINFLINASSPIRFYLLFIIIITTVLFYTTLTVSLWKNGRTQKR